MKNHHVRVFLVAMFLLLCSRPYAVAQEGVSIDLEDAKYMECSFEKIDTKRIRKVINDQISKDLKLDLTDPVIYESLAVFSSTPCTGLWLQPQIFTMPAEGGDVPIGLGAVSVLGKRMFGKMRKKKKESRGEEVAAVLERDILLIGSFDGLHNKPGVNEYELGFRRFRWNGVEKQAFNDAFVGFSFKRAWKGNEEQSACGTTATMPFWRLGCGLRDQMWREHLQAKDVQEVPTIVRRRVGGYYPGVVMISFDPAIYVRLDHEISGVLRPGDSVLHRHLGPRVTVLVMKDSDALISVFTEDLIDDLTWQPSEGGDATEDFFHSALLVGAAVVFGIMTADADDGSPSVGDLLDKLLRCGAQAAAGHYLDDPLLAAAVAQIFKEEGVDEVSLRELSADAVQNLLVARLRDRGDEELATAVEVGGFGFCMVN